MLLTGLWCTRSDRLGSLTQPTDNPAGRVDAYWCLSSCIDVRTYYIPFPSDVTYPGAVCVCASGKWHNCLRQNILIKLVGLPCLYVHQRAHSRKNRVKEVAAVEDYSFLNKNSGSPPLTRAFVQEDAAVIQCNFLWDKPMSDLTSLT